MSYSESYESEQPNLDKTELIKIFRGELIACLTECASGRLGLFSNREIHGSEHDGKQGWPEAAQLRELAFALQAITAQEEETDVLCEQFLDLCSIHGEADPGEPKLAKAFLESIRSME